MTPTGIELPTFQLIAHCFGQLRRKTHPPLELKRATKYVVWIDSNWVNK
jgi:hypothetical protein